MIVFTSSVMCQTLVGKWVTIDEDSGVKKSQIELYKKDGKLYGKITYLYPKEGREANPKCTKCEDYRKNQPWIGMEIIKDLVWNGSEWEGGTVLDPGSGKIYSLTMWIDPENSNWLYARGYVGPFYRTQHWKKES